jgi:hypothetical protein
MSLQPFHPDPNYVFPYPFTRDTESVDEWLLGVAAINGLTGQEEQVTRIIRGWATLNAVVLPDKREFLASRYALELPAFESKTGSTKYPCSYINTCSKMNT